MKKLAMIFMVVLIFFMPIFNTYNQQTAHANVISKPLTITAKKVAKELAQESAVAMAEHILFEKAINEFINSDVDEGYKAVCLTGAVDKIENCAPDKRAQVKANLTSNDKKAISNKVEQVLEQKTNTSSKWAKFLDWFIPIFLISGLVATFESMIDGESESLIDEIAMESLTDLNYIKGLSSAGGDGGNENVFEPVKFSDVVKSAEISVASSGSFQLAIVTHSSNHSFTVTIKDRTHTVRNGNLFFIQNNVSTSKLGDKWRGQYDLSGYNFNNMMNVSAEYRPTIVVTDYDYSTSLAAQNAAKPMGQSIVQGRIQGSNVDTLLNSYFGVLQTMFYTPIQFSLNPIVQPPVQMDKTPLPALQTIKNTNGTVTTPGIDAFKYTHGQNEIYPSPDSTTGWKEKTTGEDIAVQEDEILVDSEIDAPPTEEDDPEEEFPSCKKDFKKIEFKKVGTAFTNAFPFSIPWDIKRFIDASFSGIGDARPSFDLPDYLGGVKLEIPAFFDSWIGFMRTFIVIVFDISIIYLFYRIMRGGGGD